MARPRGGEWLGSEIAALRAAGVDELVSLLTEEEISELDLGDEGFWCEQHQIIFRSFPIVDRSVPVWDVASFRFIETLDRERCAAKTMVIHCRMGIGRSALVGACLLVIEGMSAATALDVIARSRGCAVPDTPAQRIWVERFAWRYQSPKKDLWEQALTDIA